MSTPLVKPENSSHWYTRDGKPCYELPNASKPGTMRPTTLRDARKLDLLPSVTSILSVVAKPGLETWKQSQCIEAALTLPRLEGESLDDFAKRVVVDSQEHSAQARELGTRVHAGCEEWMINMGYSGTPTINPMVEAFAMWYVENVKEAVVIEHAVASPLGFGGKLDLLCVLRQLLKSAIVDIKTQGTKKDKPVNAYPEHGMQLVAYEKACGPKWGRPLRLLNVIISTTEPGRIEVVDWTDKRDELWEAFQAAFTLWRFLKGYDPRKGK